MKNKNLLSERVIKNRKLYLFAIYLLVVGVFLLPKTAVFASEITTSKLIELTNQERINNNLPPLSINSKLEEAATNKANSLITNQYFSHTSPDGKNFSEWIKEVNYEYVYAGENLAMDFITAEGVVKAWMNSESHKKNILSQLYDETAIAITSGIFNDQPTTIITQLFGRQKQLPKNEELTLINFNGIINDNKNNIVFPSLLYSNTGDLVSMKSGKTSIKLSTITVTNKIPLKNKFVTNNRKVNPIVAGAMTKSISNKNLNLNNNIYSILPLILMILIGYISVILFKITNKKQLPFFYSYK